MQDKLSQTTIMIDPLTKDRFYVSFSPTSKLNGQLIISIDLPKCELIDNKIKWSPIKFIVNDIIGRPSISEHLMSWLKKGLGENFEILQMASNFDVINKWKIYDSKILSIDFGNCDHNLSALNTITVVVQPDRCELY